MTLRATPVVLVGFAVLVMIAQPTSAHAQLGPGATPQNVRDIAFLLRMDLDLGGDRIIDVAWSDGKMDTLRAGQLFTFSGGLVYHPAAPWAVEATVGYKFDKANGTNGSISFTRIPVDLIVSWVSGRNRLGGGATVHFAPNFSCDAFGVCNSNVSLDTAVGAIVQWAYCIRPREDIGVNLGLELGLRASYIKYSGSGVEPLNGSNAGLFFGFWF